MSMNFIFLKRKLANALALSLICGLALLAIIPLLFIFMYVLKNGFPALDLNFFTELPKPVGEDGGGMGNALLGSSVLLGMAALLSIPFGVACGIYLSEFKITKTAGVLRFTIDLLSSVPSIIVGVFVYSILVIWMKGFSAHAGAAALSILVIPVVARSTEEILKLVPNHIREAGLALGIPRWKVILGIVLKGARGGILTGIILAIARAAGETAPLLFTAFGNRGWMTSLNQPIASLPVQIYSFAISPFDDWHRQAWAGALVLVMFVFVLNLATRLIFSKRS